MKTAAHSFCPSVSAKPTWRAAPCHLMPSNESEPVYQLHGLMARKTIDDVGLQSMVRASMSNNNTSLDRIAQLKAEIAKLEQGALQELMDRRNDLSHELAAIDAEIAKLTGKAVAVKRPVSSAPKAAGKSLPLQELKELLAQAPDKTLNIRKAGLDTANIKTLAKANPSLLGIGGKGAWPTVTLLK